MREHAATVTRLGHDVVRVKTPAQLATCDALVIPGGESTAIAHLLETSSLRVPLAERLTQGMSVLGTCAGLILLSSVVLDGRSDQWSFGALDVTVRRNGYGRQTASFESDVRLSSGEIVPGVFIRAPRIEAWGSEIEVLATHNHGDGAHPVLVRRGAVWGCSFHPELTTSTVVHQRWLDTVACAG